MEILGIVNTTKNTICILIFQITENENLKYDQKIGFILRSPAVRDSGVFNCEANRDNITESLPLTVFINREFLLLIMMYRLTLHSFLN